MRNLVPSSLLIGAVFIVGLGQASAEEFTVEPGKIQLVQFESEAPIEDIRGISTEASGSLTVDVNSPTKTSGKISVPVGSLRTGNTTRDGHLQQQMWLDAKAHPNLEFSIDSVKFATPGALSQGGKFKGTAKGKLTIKGVTKVVEVPIRVTYLAASERLKKAYIFGNALRIKVKFDVTLKDYGVEPPDHIAGVKVAETVTIKAALTAVQKAN